MRYIAYTHGNSNCEIKIKDCYEGKVEGIYLQSNTIGNILTERSMSQSIVNKIKQKEYELFAIFNCSYTLFEKLEIFLEKINVDVNLCRLYSYDSHCTCSIHLLR